MNSEDNKTLNQDEFTSEMEQEMCNGKGDDEDE